MTTESTQPQPEMGPSPANGQGQSQGHRRRRRRRKNKSNRPGAAQAQAAQNSSRKQPAAGTGASATAGSVAAAPQAATAAGSAAAEPAAEKEEVLREGFADPQPQPGNSVSGPQQGKRKQKQRGPREFVGPMDHSYRAVNGNIADGPASTIQITSNGHGSYYPELYQAPAPPAPVRHDAPTRIFCFIDDLFFLAKIQETARKLGVKVEFVKGTDKEVSCAPHGYAGSRPAPAACV